MVVVENKQYSIDYLDPHKRSIANAVQIHFKDGTSTDVVECEYPLGHRFRRDEAIPQIIRKFSSNIQTHYSQKQMKNIQEVCLNAEKLSSMPVNEFMDLFFI